jgi:hypothetical protein
MGTTVFETGVASNDAWVAADFPLLQARNKNEEMKNKEPRRNFFIAA